MKATPVLLAAALSTLTGCPSTWPKGQFTAEHDLGDPPRVHSWSFAPSGQPGDLDLLRGEIARRLAASGWLEAPADQAEFLVETAEVVGEGEWADATLPGLAMVSLLADVTALSSGGEPSGPPEPVFELRWPRYLRIRFLHHDSGLVAYEGRASALDATPEGSTLNAALARELLRSFPRKAGTTWIADIPPYPSAPPTRAAATGRAVAAPALPPRLACAEAVPVVAFRRARCWLTPDARRAFAFQLEAVTSGCATSAANGLVHVALADGRSGFISQASVLYHPGP